MSERRRHSPQLERRPARRFALTAAAAGGVIALILGGLIAFAWFPFGSAPPPPTSDAEPYVRDFANALEGEVNEPLDTPAPFSYGENVDGCDHGYGAPNVCVPYNFPPQVAKNPAAKCAYLASHKFKALEVTGEDRHKLAPEGGPRSPSGRPYACPDVLPTG
jgi:hypothetical protein